MAHSVNTVIRTTMSAVSVPASSSSSSSDDELVYGTLQAGTSLQSPSHQKQVKSWNYPRKTIKAIDSMGRIERRSGLTEASNSSRRSTAPNKRKKLKIKGHKSRFKRLLELSKPKSVIASNENDDSSIHFKKVQSSRLQKQRRDRPKHCFDSASGKHSGPENISRCKTVAKIKPLPMVYRTTEHTAKLAEPRERNEVGMRLLGRVLESALFAKASKRLVELATPRKGSVNVPNENVATRTPYGVSNEALKAVCSPRILELSVPRNPKNLLNRNNDKKVESKQMKPMSEKIVE